MSTQVQWRGGTTAQHASFTGAAREVTVDTDKKTLVVHDGSKAGGYPVPGASDLAALNSAIAGKANTSHTHTREQVVGLADDLEWRAPRDGTGAYGTWPINITGMANYANSADYANSAGNGGVTSVNGMTGAVTVNAGTAGVASLNGLTGGVTLLVPLSVFVSSMATDTMVMAWEVEGNGLRLVTRYGPSSPSEPTGGDSLHPDSIIELSDGAFRWLRDIRVGDMVRGRTGAVEVLGIWTAHLESRSLWYVETEAGVVACTPGHLIPCRDESGIEVWGAPAPEQYWSLSHGKRRPLKGKRGPIDTHCQLGTTPEAMVTLAIGVPILCADGQYRPITALREVLTLGKAGSDEPYVNPVQQMISLYLDGSNLFYADGLAVSTLA
jgi:hypothetical protein